MINEEQKAFQVQNKK